MVVVDFDSDVDGIVIVNASGTWTVGQVDGLYHYLGHRICELRKRNRPVRVLIKLDGLAKPAPDVSARTVWQIKRVFNHSDRVAILTDDIAQKLRLRALFAETEVAVFNSLLPTEMWLVNDIAKPH